ncbi:hypothetical protein H8E77_04985 [bacterium]|nr:hypothetical protein [bacterium]
MSAVPDDNLTVEQLFLRVKQLSPAELHEFTRKFLAWQNLLRSIGEQNRVAVHEVLPLSVAKGNAERSKPVSQSEMPRNEAEEEAALLACIEENSHLPTAEQQRYENLRRKCEQKTLTESERASYHSLLQKLEARNVKRIEALITLAKRHGTTLRGIIAELGLKGADDDF